MIISSCLNPTLGDEEQADLASFTPSQARPPCFLGLLFPAFLSQPHPPGLAARIWGPLIDAWGLFPF